MNQEEEKAEQIFVCGYVNNAIRAGADPADVSGMREIVSCALEVWRGRTPSPTVIKEKASTPKIVPDPSNLWAPGPNDKYLPYSGDEFTEKMAKREIKFGKLKGNEWVGLKGRALAGDDEVVSWMRWVAENFTVKEGKFAHMDVAMIKAAKHILVECSIEPGDDEVPF